MEALCRPLGYALGMADAGHRSLQSLHPTFVAWARELGQRRRVIDLGSGSLGAFPLGRETRVILVDVQRRFRPEVVGDVQRLPFRDASLDGVLAMSVLEHVPRPWEAVAEIHRVLAPGGLVLGYVPYMYPYHADETFHDYFRFSDEAIESLFAPFHDLRILPAGGYTNALLRFAAGFTASQRHLLRLERPTARFLGGIARSTGIWDSVRLRGLRRTTTGYNFYAVK